MAETELPRILCVDDEVNILSALRRQMRSKFNITTAGGGTEALELMKAEDPFDVIISDYRMPHMDGAEFLKQAKALDPSATRILLTGQASLEQVQATVNEGGIYKILLKPVSREELHEAIYGAVELNCDKKSASNQLGDQFDELLKSLAP